MTARDIQDGSRLEGDRVLQGDVAVVGTGAGGGVTAEILAKAGLKVVMVEEGAYRTAQDFSLRELEAYASLYFDAASRKTHDGGISILQGRTVGGSTTVNWTSTFRTPEPTLRYWAANHQVRGLSPEEMAPWFEKMEHRLNVEPWSEPPNANNAALARGAGRLGWTHKVIPRNVEGCENLGYCGLGCPVNAKQDMRITTVAGALDHGATLLTRVRATRLVLRQDRVRGLECMALDADGVKPTGHKVRVEAPVVVVAGGGINSPALLLRSKTPDPHQVLGRRTFLHPVNASMAIMPEVVDGFAGAPQSVYSDQFLWRDGVTGRVGYKLEVPPLQPVLALSGQFRMGPGLAYLASSYRHQHVTIALLRDGFNAASPGGRIVLRDDGSGVLDYPVTPYLWEGLTQAFLSMAECQFAAGARAVVPAHMDARIYRSWKEAQAAIPHLPHATPHMTLYSAHVMGGCAMGEDAHQAVVTSDGRHHQVENLYVIDGSVFPTSLGANPQMSIYGLAARNASRLAEHLTGRAHPA